MCIDSSSTHNFIHCKVDKELNLFLYSSLEFHVMVVNGGTINFSRKCHNIKLNMGEYVLNSPVLGCRCCIMSPMVTIFGDDNFSFSRKFHELFIGRKGNLIKGHHKETKKNNML